MNKVPKGFYDSELYVANWFHTKGFVMKPNGHYIGECEDGTDFARLCLDYQKDYRIAVGKLNAVDRTGKKLKMPKSFSDATLEKALETFLTDERKRVRKILVDSFAYTSANSATEQLVTWLTAVVGKPTLLQIAVVKHFMWMVKRKMFGKPVVYHIMPIFWGEQGGGKSEAIKKLIHPLQFLTLHWDMQQGVDSRNLIALSKNYIAVFDEMAKADRADIEDVKRTISLDTFTVRPLYSNRQIEATQNCSFIGISNKSVIELIQDETGLRRFFEFTCLPKLDWAAINACDPLEIWRSVDESLERGYIEEFKAELVNHQKDLAVPDEMQDFLTSMEILPLENQSTVEITSMDLYNAFTNWRINYGHSSTQPIAHVWFARKAGSYNLRRQYKRIEGVKTPVYQINAAAHILKANQKPKTVEGTNLVELKWTTNS